MIVITDNRNKAVYARANRRTQWRYAEYCGRWATIDEAIESVKVHFPNQKVEYCIEDGDEMITGFTN